MVYKVHCIGEMIFPYDFFHVSWRISWTVILSFFVISNTMRVKMDHKISR